MNKNVKFEDSMARLEKIVEQMENGELELEKSLELFEEGVKLVRVCSNKLEETKKKVEVLIKKNGKIVQEPFKEDKEDGDTTAEDDLFK